MEGPLQCSFNREDGTDQHRALKEAKNEPNRANGVITAVEKRKLNNGGGEERNPASFPP